MRGSQYAYNKKSPFRYNGVVQALLQKPQAKRDELEHKLKHGAGNMENIEIMTPESDFCWGIKITGYIYAVKLCFNVENGHCKKIAVPVLVDNEQTPKSKSSCMYTFFHTYVKTKNKGMTYGNGKKKNTFRHF